MTTATISVIVDLIIKAFSGAGITEYASGITNGIVQKLGGRVQVTQRPSIDLFVNASETVGTDSRGRGVYYWEENSTLYLIDNDTVYRNDYGTTVGTISAGTERVSFFESLNSTGNPVLMVADAENNNAFSITTGHALAAHTPTNFPTTIVHGGAILNGTWYLMDESGIIYNSAVDNVDSFPATGFISAERNEDSGVYLGRHREGIVALGTRTVEFFYDNANNVGSPLNRRPEIFHNLGCGDGLSVWENGDIIYFVGSDPSGTLGVYKLENYSLEKVSSDTLDSYVNHNVTQESFRVVGSGFNGQGHLFYILTLYSLTTDATPIISPAKTIVFDTLTTLWGMWSTSLNGNTMFPLMAWTKRTGGFNANMSSRIGEGILANGDIITLGDNMVPLDTVLGFTGYFVDTYMEVGYFSLTSPDQSTNIDFGIRTGNWNGGTNKLKFQHSVKATIDETPTSQTMVLKWSTGTEQDGTFTTGRTLDTSKRDIARRGGKFTKRNFDLSYSGDEQLYVDDIEIDVTVGDY